MNIQEFRQLQASHRKPKKFVDEKPKEVAKVEETPKKTKKMKKPANIEFLVVEPKEENPEVELKEDVAVKKEEE